MLETDDIEDDYFTPASSTTLANIFGKTKSAQTTENESLKYIPPKPQSLSPKQDESSAPQCIFACALFGFEWVDNAYTPKRKLGFAILKTVKTGAHNVVLYNSNKTTLSCTTLSPALEVTVQEKVNISYYDNSQKYWSIYCLEKEAEKIIDILNSLNVTIKYSTNNEKGPPQPKEMMEPEAAPTIESLKQIDKESDTDSSINRRTKMSILNRISNMGHSVLPPNTVATEKTSDSSDTNDTNNHPKTTRHKVVKSTVKRNSSEKNVSDIQSLVESHKFSRPEPCVENTPPLYTLVNGQLVPVTTTNIITSPSSSNDMNLFISEQRVNNSEMRININRMTDKVDQILSKITDLRCTDVINPATNFQTEVLQKLLMEYESKIKAYEEVIKLQKIDKPFNIDVVQEFGEASLSKQPQEDINKLNSSITDLQYSNTIKDLKISQLESELEALRKQTNEINSIQGKNNALIAENEELKQQLVIKNDELFKITQQDKASTATDYDNDMREKIKHIMNNAFHAIADNFESNGNYTGDSIKNVIATVIKRVTKETLNDL